MIEPAHATPPHSTAKVRKLTRSEAMHLLASVPYGRVVFTLDALPAIRPVNHTVTADGRIIVRMRLNTSPTRVARAESPYPTGVVVAYEADDLDPHLQSGWSVVVTGLATSIASPEKLAACEQPHAWVNTADAVVSIEPRIVSGIRITSHPGNR